jgi:GNAT superfamily N-acetyltransferase
VIFNTLWDAARHNELILIDGALCHWHLRRDGQLTIYELIVLPQLQRQGRGRSILRSLSQVPGARVLVARCPADLPANTWYQHQGFHHVNLTQSNTGREIITWSRDTP